MGVEVDVVEAERVLRAALHTRPEVAVFGGIGLTDEGVGELVADERRARL